MKVYSAEEIPQGTTRWQELRKGIPTTSRFDSIITPGGRKSDGQDAYMHHLLAERVIGKPIMGFKSKDMEHGNQFEGNAIAAYEFDRGVTTQKIGFVVTDDGRIGCSPDSFIVEDPKGMVEAKAPSAATHVSYLLAAMGAGKEYKVQLAGELWVCEKEYVDIISYCEGFPDAIYRTYRDEEFIKKMADLVREFSDRLEEKTEMFKAKGWIKPPEPQPENLTGDDFLTDDDAAWHMARWEPGGDQYEKQQPMPGEAA